MRATELLSELDIRFVAEGHEHCREGWVQVDCPFCSKNSQHWRMGFNLTFGYVHCWHCGHHNLAETLTEASQSPLKTVYALIAQLERERPKIGAVGPLKRQRLKLPKARGELLKPHKQFLERRGFDPDEIVELWGVQGIPFASKYAWRLFIPITLNGEIVSFTTRKISDSQTGLRYLSASADEEKYPHRDLLYGEDHCRHAIAVQEGSLDAWTLGPGAVATLGTGYSRAQLVRMTKYPLRVVCFDNEPSAQRRARKLVNDLTPFPGETINCVFSGKDASRSPKKEVREFRKRFLI